jgi:hypothetical protein
MIKGFIFINLQIDRMIMGKTIPPFRPALEMELATWFDFKRALRPEDRPVFDLIGHYTKIHGDAESMACRPLISEVIYMCALIEQQKQIHELQTKLQKITEKLEKITDTDEN